MRCRSIKVEVRVVADGVIFKMLFVNVCSTKEDVKWFMSPMYNCIYIYIYISISCGWDSTHRIGMDFNYYLNLN